MLNLVKRAQNQDGEAFVQLMEAHKEGMYKVARAYLSQDADVADAMQDTVLDCFEKIHTLQEPRYFKTWMIRILIRNCIAIQRKNQRSLPVEDEAYFEGEAPKEDLRAFLELLESLDEQSRIIFILYYVEGFKIKEIARILGEKENTVSSRLRRGRIRIRRDLQEPLDEEGLHEGKKLVRKRGQRDLAKANHAAG